VVVLGLSKRDHRRMRISLTNEFMCSASLLYALKSENESLVRSAGDCDAISEEAMGGLSAIDGGYARRGYLIATDKIKGILRRANLS
jgi:hypothetical protein